MGIYAQACAHTQAARVNVSSLVPAHPQPTPAYLCVGERRKTRLCVCARLAWMGDSLPCPSPLSSSNPHTPPPHTHEHAHVGLPLRSPLLSRPLWKHLSFADVFRASLSSWRASRTRPSPLRHVHGPMNTTEPPSLPPPTAVSCKTPCCARHTSVCVCVQRSYHPSPRATSRAALKACACLHRTPRLWGARIGPLVEAQDAATPASVTAATRHASIPGYSLHLPCHVSTFNSATLQHTHIHTNMHATSSRLPAGYRTVPQLSPPASSRTLALRLLVIASPHQILCCTPVACVVSPPISPAFTHFVDSVVRVCVCVCWRLKQTPHSTQHRVPHLLPFLSGFSTIIAAGVSPSLAPSISVFSCACIEHTEQHRSGAVERLEDSWVRVRVCVGRLCSPSARLPPAAPLHCTSPSSRCCCLAVPVQLCSLLSASPGSIHDVATPIASAFAPSFFVSRASLSTRLALGSGGAFFAVSLPAVGHRTHTHVQTPLLVDLYPSTPLVPHETPSPSVPAPPLLLTARTR